MFKKTTTDNKSTQKITKGLTQEEEKTLDAKKNSGVATLSYLGILFIVPLFGNRDSKFAQFHAKQGIVLFGLEIIAFTFSWFPVIGQLTVLALILISIMGVIKTYNEEWWEIPFIYDLSKKIKF